HRQTQQRRRALLEASEQARLIPGVEAKRVDQVGANQRSFEVVECRRCQVVPPGFSISRLACGEPLEVTFENWIANITQGRRFSLTIKHTVRHGHTIRVETSEILRKLKDRALLF